MYYYSFLQLLLMLLSSLPAVSFCMLALRSKLCFPFPVTALALVAYYSVYLAVSACTATFAPSLGNLVLPLFFRAFFYSARSARKGQFDGKSCFST